MERVDLTLLLDLCLDALDRDTTEIDSINGAIVRQAKSLNIKTPTNEMLTELVKSIEMNYKNIVKEPQPERQ